MAFPIQVFRVSGYVTGGHYFDLNSLKQHGLSHASMLMFDLPLPAVCFQLIRAGGGTFWHARKKSLGARNPSVMRIFAKGHKANGGEKDVPFRTHLKLKDPFSVTSM